MRTRKPSDVSFPVPKLGFQTDELVDTLIDAMSEKPGDTLSDQLRKWTTLAEPGGSAIETLC